MLGFARAKAKLTAIERHIGNRRRDCWWEPIYDPILSLEMDPYDWDLQRDAGPFRRFVPASTLTARISPGETFDVRNATFRQCDFQGSFEGNPLIMFEGCRFIGCDFAYSSWRRIHFKDCTFENTSLSLARFDACDFRGCTWNRIGIASRTDLTKTYISNPGQLINATVSGIDPRTPTVKHRMYQWHRLRGTRAHCLRSIMLTHATTGDEHIFYDTVRLHELQRSSARVAQDLYEVAFGDGWNRVFYFFKTILHSFNYLILRTLGWLNGWGESAGRPFVALLSCWGIFAGLYKYAPFLTDISRPFQKSFDITFLVGYGEQTAPSNDLVLAATQDVHTIISIVIYSVFFATVISKLSRTR